jgi:hypothetical protein
MDQKRMNINRHLIISVIVMAVMATTNGLTGFASAMDGSILHRINTISTVASTVPANGDVNPYGVAIVERSVGKLIKGHILVSNFNNSSNLQGTGSTIVDVGPNGSVSLFAQIDAGALPGLCPGGVGLTTALVALRSGWVIVGSLPTADGTAATAQAGCLIVLDKMGKPVETIYGTLINGPWDMVADETDHEATLFVTNVLNDTVAGNGQIVNKGTVVRINLDIHKDTMPSVESLTIIGSGFSERTDPAALVIGPTGVGISPDHKKLYVADSLANRIAVIDDPFDRSDSAGIGLTLTSGGTLNDPLGLIVVLGGNILTVNGNDGFITEITPQGRQIAHTLLDNTGSPPGAGTLFGLAFNPSKGLYFVDDGTNTLNLLH